MFAGGHVQLSIVTNRRDATTLSTATLQLNACEKALADRFHAPHKHQGAHNSPNMPSKAGMFAGGRVQLTFVTNRRDATVSTAT